MSFYIYLFHGRFIYWTSQTLYSRPAEITEVKWYAVDLSTPLPLNDMIERGDVSYSAAKGFFTIDEPLPVGWEERHNVVKKIQIMETFNAVANTQKSRFTDNSIGQGLTDALLLDEIREYRRTKNLENCTILTSLLEDEGTILTPDALVVKLWLKFESYRAVIAHLNRIEQTIRQQLREKNFDKANELIKAEIEKIRM